MTTLQAVYLVTDTFLWLTFHRYLENTLTVTREENRGRKGNKLGAGDEQRYTVLYMKEITSQDLLYRTGNGIQCLVITSHGKESETVCIHARN